LSSSQRVLAPSVAMLEGLVAVVAIEVVEEKELVTG
jgi:uncharacterized membrane protein YqjE